MRHPIDRLTPGMVFNNGRRVMTFVEKLPRRTDKKGREVFRAKVRAGGEDKTITATLPQSVEVCAVPVKCECTSVDYCARCLEKMSK